MIYILSLIGYIILFVSKKRFDFILYELLCAFNYLLVLSFIQTLDITLPTYLVFAILPYISEFRIKNILSLIFLVYFTTVMVISIFLNGIWQATSIFLIRLAGMLFCVYVFSNIKQNIKLKYIHVILSLIFEVILTIIGIIKSPDGRLMLNYQCTVGCLATAFVLLLAYDVYRNHRLFTIIAMLFHTLIACLSGTRGYILVCLSVTLVSLLLFSTVKEKAILFPLIFSVLLLNYDKIVSLVLNNLRFGEGTGIRNVENTFVIQFMSKQPIKNILFGNGFGTQTQNYNISNDIILGVAKNTYQIYALHRQSGFHNFWFTILYSAGIVGLVLVIVLYISILKDALRFNIDIKMKLVFLVFFFSYAILLWYRWTATSGVLEFAVFSCIVKWISNDIEYKCMDK